MGFQDEVWRKTKKKKRRKSQDFCSGTLFTEAFFDYYVCSMERLVPKSLRFVRQPCSSAVLQPTTTFLVIKPGDPGGQREPATD